MINFIVKYQKLSFSIYYWLLVIIAVSMPFSPFLMSLGQILLLLNWIAEGNFDEKWRILKIRKSIWFFIAFYLMHIIWLIGTEDWKFTEETLRIKLPMLILPIIIGTSKEIPVEKIHTLLKFFIASIISATIFSLFVYYGFTGHEIKDIRDISIFISHIRFSLMIVLCILTILHWIKEDIRISKKQFLLVLIVIWFVLFLIFMKALTGLVILSVTMFLLILIFVNRVDNPILKIFLIIILYSIPFIGIVSIIKTYNIYYNKNNYNVSQLPMYTPNGNKYLHDTLSWEKENGKLVRLYLCEDELRKEWNKRSKIKYDSTDKKGQDLKSTLIRYMTSKGLTKDSAGITKLTGKDIINIEKGLTNYIFEKKWSITPRLYEVIWEIDHYCHTGSTNNQSVTQRFIYLKIAIYLIKKNFVFGVGTGDLPKEYLNYYETHNTGLEKDKWWNTHNQYLRVFATFGLIGFIIFILAFFMPPYFERKYNSYYFIMIFIIILLSFVNEDTLETQAGVTFSTFFYALFLWGADRKLK